jgi:4a-hydroxytetrahydrobiopterin dehydratase
MDPLDRAALGGALAGLEGWREDSGALVRELTFVSFMAAIAFIGRVAELAEAADHHPELRNVHRHVVVRLSTHEAGGITSRDVDMAHAIDGIVRAEG